MFCNIVTSCRSYPRWVKYIISLIITLIGRIAFISRLVWPSSNGCDRMLLASPILAYLCLWRLFRCIWKSWNCRRFASIHPSRCGKGWKSRGQNRRWISGVASLSRMRTNGRGRAQHEKGGGAWSSDPANVDSNVVNMLILSFGDLFVDPSPFLLEYSNSRPSLESNVDRVTN